MPKLVLMAALVLLALLLPWQLGYDPASLAAPTPFTIGWAAIKPAPVAAGAPTTIEARVQARTASSATIEASVLSRSGQVAWQQRWPTQSFKAWENRTLTTTWAVPSSQAAGAYTLRVRVLGSASGLSSASELAAPRTATFQITGSPAPNPTATATPPPATATATPPQPTATATPRQPTATATPAPGEGAWYPRIVGSAAYQAATRAALDQIRTQAPQDYAVVRQYIDEVRESSRNWYWGGARSIELSTATMTYGTAFAASSVVHEAVHAKNWFTNNFPAFGCEGEAKSLRAQAAYLTRVNQAALARYIESLIGSWC